MRLDKRNPSARPIASRARLRWFRRGLVFALVLVPVAPVVLGLALTAGSNAAPGASAFTPVTLSASTPPPTPPPAAAKSPIPAGPGAIVAEVLHTTDMRASPNGRLIARITTRTNFGSRATLWVVQHTAGWLGVVSPVAGNGHVGWIQESAASLTRVPVEIKVALSAHRLTVLENGKVLKQYPVADGASGSPTPTGRFDVTDRLLTGDPTGPYGCCILALSAYAPHAIADWNGGNRVAIHSTPESSSIGFSVTHGCVRVHLADGHWLLYHIPLGTPVLISA